MDIGKNIEKSNSIDTNSLSSLEEKHKFKDLLLETLNSNSEKNLQLNKSIEESKEFDSISNQKNESKKEENKTSPKNVQTEENNKKIENFNQDSLSLKEENTKNIQQNIQKKESTNDKIKREERDLIDKRDVISFTDRKTSNISKSLNLFFSKEDFKLGLKERTENSEKIKNEKSINFKEKLSEIKMNNENPNNQNKKDLIEDTKYFVAITANVFKGNKEVFQLNNKNTNIKDKEAIIKTEKKDTKEIIQETLRELINKKKEENLELSNLKSLEKELNDKNQKIEVFVKQEGNFNLKESLKKEGEFKNQNENQLKNFLETNIQNLKTNNDLLKESSFKDILNKSIKEGLEELVQKAKINIINKDQFSAQIRLNPAIFGYMSLDIKMENQSLILKILVDNQEVYKKLQENLEFFKNEFLKQGIQVDQFQIRMKENFFSNEHENKSLFEQFSNFENSQNHSHSQDYENFSFDLNSISNQKEIEKIQKIERNLDSSEVVSYNFYDQKINLWG